MKDFVSVAAVATVAMGAMGATVVERGLRELPWAGCTVENGYAIAAEVVVDGGGGPMVGGVFIPILFADQMLIVESMGLVLLQESAPARNNLNFKIL